jgi:hypothetical protein
MFMTVWCKILLIAVLMTETFLWLSDHKWIILTFLLLDLAVSGAPVKQLESKEVVHWIFVLQMRSWHKLFWG